MRGPHLVRLLIVNIVMALCGCAVVSIAARVLTVTEVVAFVHQFARSFADDLTPSQLPTRSPAPLAGIAAAVTGAGDSSLVLNGAPGAGGLVDFPDGTVVLLLCYREGPRVTGPNGTTPVWNRVRVPDGRTGYMSDAYVDTGSSGPVVPHCGS